MTQRTPAASGPATDDARGALPIPVESRVGHAWFASTGLRTGARMLPVLRRAEMVLARQSRAIARRPTRIPADAIVAIGSLPSPLERPVDVTTAVANDNGPRVSPRVRTILREIAFLLIFGATLAGTYYLGRHHAFHNVIVVPDTTARGNVIV